MHVCANGNTNAGISPFPWLAGPSAANELIERASFAESRWRWPCWAAVWRRIGCVFWVLMRDQDIKD
jgi:hypothetical protein